MDNKAARTDRARQAAHALEYDDDHDRFKERVQTLVKQTGGEAGLKHLAGPLGCTSLIALSCSGILHGTL